MRLFNERGYAAVSMSLIAKEAGLTKATLYYHFPGKAELLTAGALDMVARVQQHIESIAGDESFTVRERLTQLVQRRYDRAAFLTYNAVMMDAAMQHLSFEQRGEIGAAFRRLSEPLEKLIAEGMARGELRAGDPQALALAFRQLFSASTQREMQRFNGAHMEDALLDIFFHGVAPCKTS